MIHINRVFDLFTRKVSDYLLLNSDVTDEEIKDELYGYLLSAKGKFVECKQSLEIISVPRNPVEEPEAIKEIETPDATPQESALEGAERDLMEEPTETTLETQNLVTELSEELQEPVINNEESNNTEVAEEGSVVEEIIEDLYFVSELTDFELEILVALMIVEYLKPRMISDETLRPALSDKDFKIYSQANQLREINLLYRLMYSESRKMITKYGYLDLGKKR